MQRARGIPSLRFAGRQHRTWTVCVTMVLLHAARLTAVEGFCVMQPECRRTDANPYVFVRGARRSNHRNMHARVSVQQRGGRSAIVRSHGTRAYLHQTSRVCASNFE